MRWLSRSRHAQAQEAAGRAEADALEPGHIGHGGALYPAARGTGEYDGDWQRPMITPDGHCPEQFRRSDCNHAYSHWPPAEPGTIEPRPWNGGPGNKRDRARFPALSAAQRQAASELAASKHDSTRTVAQCWAEALDETDRQESAYEAAAEAFWQDQPDPDSWYREPKPLPGPHLPGNDMVCETGECGHEQRQQDTAEREAGS